MKRYLGVAWYPELWPEEVWQDDIRKMKLAGVNLVRVGEFAWSFLEPHEGDIHPAALLPAVKLAIENGLDVVMCTPTATPPVWLSHGFPGRMHVDREGVCMSHGGRQQMCFGQETFNLCADRITKALAEVFGDLPGIVAWQLDNELMANVSECYCDDCVRRFTLWLEKTYGTTEAMNEAWGAGIWSQAYERFEQVPAPRMTPAGQNVSLVTSYKRFQQEEAATFITRQAAILHALSDKPVTLNSSLNHYLDHPATFRNLDFASFDHYSHSSEPHRMRFFMDVFRTLKPDMPWWVMETAPSYSGCWMGHMPLHEAGYLATEAVQAWALGAQTFSLWLWRQQRSGSEIEHGSVLQAWGTPSPGFREVRRAADLLGKMGPLLEASAPVRADIALMWSDVARAYFRTEPLEGGCAEYGENIGHWHKLLFKAGWPVDGVFPDDPLETHAILLTPCLPDMPENVIHNGRRLMERGGTWICGPLSGFRTSEHTVPTDHALGAFGKTFELPDMTVVPLTGSGTTGAAMGVTAKLGWFSALAVPEGEDGEENAAFGNQYEDGPGDRDDGKWIILGRTMTGPVSGMPFILERRFGLGRLILLGSMPQGVEGDAMLTALLRRVTGSSVMEGLPEGITAIPRDRNDRNGRIWVLVNLTSEPKRWAPSRRVHSLLDDRTLQPGYPFIFRPFDVCVIEHA